MTDQPILVVDDDPSILATLAEFLDMEGYTVQTASNGAEALRSLERIQPSMVLLDMRMPVLDGWGFVRALHSQGRSLPIMVMTAAQDAREWAEEVGAIGYLAKPFDLMEILSAVEGVAG
jgi:two-component system, chemotaxis family, chemotaxis protein CheY